MLLDEAGWFPPNAKINVGEILATHGTDRNEQLCASCHVNSFTINDEATGEFVFQSTGHLFTAIPCVDAQGIPTPGACGVTTTKRSFKGCKDAGCHATKESTAMALTSSTNRIQSLNEQLHDILTLVDANLEETGGEIDLADPTFTVKARIPQYKSSVSELMRLTLAIIKLDDRLLAKKQKRPALICGWMPAFSICSSFYISGCVEARFHARI